MIIKDEFRNLLMWRWSLVSSIVVALFWTIWFIVNGSVPVVTEISVTSEFTLPLPFPISRWWDILMGPVYSIFIIYILSVRNKTISRPLQDSLIFGLVVALPAGIIAGLIAGYSAAIATGLCLLIVWHAADLMAQSVTWREFAVSVGLTGAIVGSLVAALANGIIGLLGAGLAIGLVAGVITKLKRSIKWLMPDNAFGE